MPGLFERGISFGHDGNKAMSESIRWVGGSFAQCSNRGCNTHTTQHAKVTKGDIVNLIAICRHCSATNDLVINADGSLRFVPAHEPSRARMGADPTLVKMDDQ